jgi:hypothetical protein
MELVRLIRERVSPPGINADQLRHARPIRNPSVETSELESGSLALTAPLETGSRLTAAIAKSMKLPQTRQFELDPVGAFVWSACDGHTNFGKIASQIQARYKMNRLEAETALAAYLQTLAQRRLITLLVKKAK